MVRGVIFRIFMFILMVGGGSTIRNAGAAELLPQSSWVRFESFAYRGTDPASDRLASASDADRQFLNPILAGFYPDPSICRVGEDYYLVNSSFWYFPGVPIFHSRDLVHWTQLGFVLDRPADFATLRAGDVSRGIYAPTLRYHDGIFYVITTLVGGGGNFYVTAKNPAGPWSQPVWLRSVDGIDPSLFFDDDGAAYVVHCAPPPGAALYNGHRSIRMRQLDLARGELSGEEKVLVNGGVDIAQQPVWIEGPHIFKRGGVYWLIAAEGGTGANHSEVAFRSDKLWGPYTPIADNPILSQRGLGERPDPVTCTGHADFVETPRGDWWAVFLGCRPYEGSWYNTGRETFLLPVSWAGDAPSILKSGQAVPRIVMKPNLPSQAATPITPPLTGTLAWTDTFTSGKLNLRWQQLRAPDENWYQLTGPGLAIAPRPVPLTGLGNPSFIACRQQHASFSATATLALTSGTATCDAGIAAFQNETHYLFLGVRIHVKSPEIFLEQVNVPSMRRATATPQILATAPLPPGAAKVELKIESSGRPMSFSYRIGEGAFKALSDNVDGSFLSTDVAGGFQGVMLGMYARKE